MTGSRRISDEFARILEQDPDPDSEPPVQVAVCVPCRRALIAKDAEYRQIGSRWYLVHRDARSVSDDPHSPLHRMRSARLSCAACSSCGRAWEHVYDRGRRGITAPTAKTQAAAVMNRFNRRMDAVCSGWTTTLPTWRNSSASVVGGDAEHDRHGEPRESCIRSRSRLRPAPRSRECIPLRTFAKRGRDRSKSIKCSSSAQIDQSSASGI